MIAHRSGMSVIAQYLNRHLFLEMTPGIIFFLVNKGWGLMPGVIALMVSTVLVVTLGWLLEKRIPIFPIIGLFLVLALGGAALVFQNEQFIKMKPTFGKLTFAFILIVGLPMRRSLLQRALDGRLHLSPRGWRVLTLRWVVIAFCFAAANEVCWRWLDTDSWVAFNAFVMPLSILGYIAITRITARRYWLEEHSPNTNS